MHSDFTYHSQTFSWAHTSGRHRCFQLFLKWERSKQMVSESVTGSTGVDEWLNGWGMVWVDEWGSEWMGEGGREWMWGVNERKWVEWMREGVSGYVKSEWVRKWVNELMNEWISEWMGEGGNERVRECGRGWVSEGVRKWVNESAWGNKWRSEEESEWGSEWMN